MSRFTEPTPPARNAGRGGQIRAAGVAGIAAVMVLAGAVPAWAEEIQPHSWDLIAHVYDLHATVVDKAGTARVSTTATTLDAVVDANVAFGKDSSALTPLAVARLGEISRQLRTAGPGTLEIDGYTDNLGSHTHGVKLSTQRARAVKAQLGDLPGVEFTIRGLAEANPIAPNDTEAGRERNRRVEVHFQGRS